MMSDVEADAEEIMGDARPDDQGFIVGYIKTTMGLGLVDLALAVARKASIRWPENEELVRWARMARDIYDE